MSADERTVTQRAIAAAEAARKLDAAGLELRNAIASARTAGLEHRVDGMELQLRSLNAMTQALIIDAKRALEVVPDGAIALAYINNQIRIAEGRPSGIVRRPDDPST